MAENAKTKFLVDPEVEKASKRILNSLIVESSEAKHPTTHIGTIEEIRQAPKYDETQERMFVIRYNDGYVYMLEREAGEEYSKLSDEELLGKDISFKMMNVTDKAIFVSHLFIEDVYRLAYKNNETLKGTIEASHFQKNNMAESYFVVSCYGDMLIMNLTDFSIYGLPKFLPAFYGEKVSFKVVGIDEKGNVHISKAKIEEVQRDRVVEELQEKPVLAEIVKVSDFGAYLTYKGVTFVLKNKDFSVDYTPVNMVKQKRDSMMVKLSYVSKSGRIFVEPVVKYKTPVTTPIVKFKRGDTTEGIVTGLTPSGIYVRISNGVDVLCPVPEFCEPFKGDAVRVKVLNIFKRKHKGEEVLGLRGVITSLLPRKAEVK